MKIRTRPLCSARGASERGGARVTEEKILTKHPLGKSGRNISKHKYETMKQAIVEALRNKELTHTELFNQQTSSKPQKYRLK
jgi:hypothetical protein